MCECVCVCERALPRIAPSTERPFEKKIEKWVPLWCIAAGMVAGLVAFACSVVVSRLWLPGLLVVPPVSLHYPSPLVPNSCEQQRWLYCIRKQRANKYFFAAKHIQCLSFVHLYARGPFSLKKKKRKRKGNKNNKKTSKKNIAWLCVCVPRGTRWEVATMMGIYTTPHNTIHTIVGTAQQ